jgi:CheY-like chemotaxis protein
MFTRPTTPSEGPSRVRILYAEDLRELRDLVRIVLTREGHSVECSANGVDALEKLISAPGAYDLLITDHYMPRMTGLELVANVRHIGFAGRIMVFSSEMNPSIAADYHKLNVDRVLFKPVYPSFLRQVVAELFPAPTPAS